VTNPVFTTRAPAATPTVYIPQNLGASGTADVTVSKAATIDGFTFIFDGTPGSGGLRSSGGILAAVSGLVLNQNVVEIGQGTSPSLRSTGLVISSAATINLATIQNNTFDGDSHTNTIAVQLDGTGTLSGVT